MIDINFILENKEYVKEALKKKLYEADIDGLCSMVIEKRNLQKKVEENQAKQNKLSKSVPMVKKEGGDVASIFATVIPRRTPVKLPGPSITIISFNSLVVILLSFRISSINGTV